MYGALGTVAKLMMGTQHLPVDDDSALNSTSASRRKSKRARLSPSGTRDASLPEGRALHVVELSQQMNSQVDGEISDMEEEDSKLEEVGGRGLSQVLWCCPDVSSWLSTAPPLSLGPPSLLADVQPAEWRAQLRSQHCWRPRCCVDRAPTPDLNAEAECRSIRPQCDGHTAKGTHTPCVCLGGFISHLVLAGDSPYKTRCWATLLAECT